MSTFIKWYIKHVALLKLTVEAYHVSPADANFLFFILAFKVTDLVLVKNV